MANNKPANNKPANNKIASSTSVLVAFAAFLMVISFFASGGKNVLITKALSTEEAAQRAISFINQYMLSGGVTASLIDVVKESGVYKIRVNVEGGEYQSYLSTDGKYLFTDTYDLEAALSDTRQEIPDVKLFVMSYCPFGLQAQKMFLPVYNLLKEKASMGVYFVDYIMHEKKEIDENLRQYCIQKEEPEKYADYLGCFVKDGDYEGCLSEADISESALDSCIEITDNEYDIYGQYEDESTWLNGRYPKFDVQAGLNQEYGIAGSPTIVINGKQVNVDPRSPENFKDIVCQSFANQPEECSQILSDQVYSSGFGLDESDSASNGGCVD